MVHSCARKSFMEARDRRRTHARGMGIGYSNREASSSGSLTGGGRGTAGVIPFAPARRFGQPQPSMAGPLIAVAGLLIRCATVAYAPDGTASRDTRALRAPVAQHHRHVFDRAASALPRRWTDVDRHGDVAGAVVAVAIVALAYWIYVERLMLAEEAFLAEQFQAEFSRWVSRTRAFPAAAGGLDSFDRAPLRSSACRASTTGC